MNQSRFSSTVAETNGRGLVAVNVFMGACGMGAADVTPGKDMFLDVENSGQGTEECIPRAQHGDSRGEASDREGGCRGELRPTQER